VRDETVTTRRTEEAPVARGPYVVTTKRPIVAVSPFASRGSFERDNLPVVSARAVATLEEARAYVIKRHNTYGAIHSLPESGGTVGPLPDGTMIQVESLSPLMLASRCGASGELMMSCLRSDDWAPLIAAFNAKQAS
jgi:hypothetical protein